jgi:hypothetical protein
MQQLAGAMWRLDPFRVGTAASHQIATRQDAKGLALAPAR